jgi:SAM-dependent methyltransferase
MNARRRLRFLLAVLRRVRRGRASAPDPAELLEIKETEEMRFWLEDWHPTLRDGGFWPGDVLTFLDEEDPAPTYLGRRWQHARAEVRRVLREAAIEDDRFFEGKVVLDIGPGPLGFPDACPARVSIGLDPLAERYAQHGLLLPDSPALYLSTGAEHIPLVSGSVDVVLARNSLDHVDDPEQVLSEVQRVLRPGGTLILNFDIDHPPTKTEPHTLTLDGVRAALSDVRVVHEQLGDHAHAGGGRTAILVGNRN